MSKLRSRKNKSDARASVFLSSFIEFKDEDMENCRLLNELFLEIRLEIIRERREKNASIDKTFVKGENKIQEVIDDTNSSTNKE